MSRCSMSELLAGENAVCCIRVLFLCQVLFEEGKTPATILLLQHDLNHQNV